MVMAMICLGLFFSGPVKDAWGQDKQNRTADPALRRQAAISLSRLKLSLSRDRYPSARAALNIWRSDALAAGTFDEVQFQEWLRRIYQKSVNSMLKWFEVCLDEKWMREADYCQKVYRIHARAINIFDQERYDEMTDRIKKRKKEIEAEEKKH